jgi:hypothetical protein
LEKGLCGRHRDQSLKRAAIRLNEGGGRDCRGNNRLPKRLRHARPLDGVDGAHARPLDCVDGAHVLGGVGGPIATHEGRQPLPFDVEVAQPRPRGLDGSLVVVRGRSQATELFPLFLRLPDRCQSLDECWNHRGPGLVTIRLGHVHEVVGFCGSVINHELLVIQDHQACSDDSPMRYAVMLAEVFCQILFPPDRNVESAEGLDFQFTELIFNRILRV